jgi:hypothetical protein
MLSSRDKLQLPNFFILGAAKSGTTSLYGYLHDHPEVHLSSIKEPSFFCSTFQLVSNPIEYFNLFKCGVDKKAIGEASHVYMTSPETPPVLNALFPEARFIVILRNPALRSYSLYQDMCRKGVETAPTFEQALVEEDGRFNDLLFQRKCKHYFWNFMYYRSSLYDQQLLRYFDYYDKSRFFIMTLSELASDPQLWMNKICEFLSISQDVEIDFTPLNVSDYPEMNPDTRAMLEEKSASMVSHVQLLAGRPLDLLSL